MLQIVRIQVNGQVQWEVAKSAAGSWIGLCRPLGLTMEGPTLDDLFTNINHAMQLMLTDLMESGELQEFLRSRGWKAESMGPQKPGQVEFEMPIGFNFGSPRDSARNLLQ